MHMVPNSSLWEYGIPPYMKIKQWFCTTPTTNQLWSIEVIDIEEIWWGVHDHWLIITHLILMIKKSTHFLCTEAVAELTSSYGPQARQYKEARICYCTKFLPSFCPYHYQLVCRQRWLSAWDQQSTKMHLTHSVFQQAQEQEDLTYPEYIQILDYKLHNWAGSFWNKQIKDINISELSGLKIESMISVQTTCELNKVAATVNTTHFWLSQNTANKVHKVFTSDYIKMAYLTFT